MKPEDVHTVSHSLSYAEQQLQERIKKNLQMYHDLQKLKNKPKSELTSNDLQFIKQTVCADGACQSSFAEGGLYAVNILVGLVPLAFFLV